MCRLATHRSGSLGKLTSGTMWYASTRSVNRITAKPPRRRSVSEQSTPLIVRRWLVAVKERTSASWCRASSLSVTSKMSINSANWSLEARPPGLKRTVSKCPFSGRALVPL